MMQKTTAYHPLTDDQPVPLQWSSTPSQTPSRYILDISQKHEISPVGISCPTMVSSSYFTSLLAEHGTLKSSWLRTSTTLATPKISVFIKIIPILNPKHSPITATKEKSLILSQLKPGQVFVSKCLTYSLHTGVFSFTVALFPLHCSPRAF